MVACFLIDLLQKLRLICLSTASRYASFSGLKFPLLMAFLIPIKFHSPDFVAFLLSNFVAVFFLSLTSFFLDLTSLEQLSRDCNRYCILQSLPYASK